MSHLYVCLFSNGHIKVGRSVNALARISQHEERVSCLGVELVDYRVFDCVAHPGPAEAALIERCVDACSKRNKNEWFEGVDFDSACEWAAECASTPSANGAGCRMNQQTGIAEAVAKFENSPSKLAKAVGNGVLRQHVEHWLKAGRVSPERCPEVSATTGIACSELNDKVDWALAGKLEAA